VQVERLANARALCGVRSIFLLSDDGCLLFRIPLLGRRIEFYILIDILEAGGVLFYALLYILER
jgi:hypothetical protein